MIGRWSRARRQQRADEDYQAAVRRYLRKEAALQAKGWAFSELAQLTETRVPEDLRHALEVVAGKADLVTFRYATVGGLSYEDAADIYAAVARVGGELRRLETGCTGRHDCGAADGYHVSPCLRGDDLEAQDDEEEPGPVTVVGRQEFTVRSTAQASLIMGRLESLTNLLTVQYGSGRCTDGRAGDRVQLRGVVQRRPR